MIAALAVHYFLTCGYINRTMGLELKHDGSRVIWKEEGPVCPPVLPVKK